MSNFTDASSGYDSIMEGYLDLNIWLKILIGYVVLFPCLSALILLWWLVYPLPADERVTLTTLIASIFSCFVLVGDYLSDILVTFALFVGEIEVTIDEDVNEATGSTENINKESTRGFTTTLFIVSSVFLVFAILGQSYLGKRGDTMEYMWLPSRIIFVSLGLFPIYLLLELVTASYYGSTRAKLGDIVRLKYVQGTVEGIPQIGLLIYLNLLGIQGLEEISAASLIFSITSLISGIVMWSFVREVYEKDYYDIQPNDINYILYEEDISKHDNKAAVKKWLLFNIITRTLECFGRLGVYAGFALVTYGWGLIALVALDVILILYYHRFTFLFSVWIELIFNLSDEGNEHIAWGEWKSKFFTTILAYITIFAQLISSDADLINFDLSSNSGIFYSGVTANCLLYPWILYLFRKQRKNNAVASKDVLESTEFDGEGIRTFDEDNNTVAKEKSWKTYTLGLFSPF